MFWNVRKEIQMYALHLVKPYCLNVHITLDIHLIKSFCILHCLFLLLLFLYKEFSRIFNTISFLFLQLYRVVYNVLIKNPIEQCRIGKK